MRPAFDIGTGVPLPAAIASTGSDPRARKYCHALSRQVKLANISATGLCMIDQMNMSMGNRFVVSLPRPSGVGLNVICTVRQTRLTGAGGFRTGAEFTGKTEWEQRLVSGVDGVVAKLPTMVADTRSPARFAIKSGAPGEFFQAMARETRGDTVVLDTAAQVAPGTALIIEISPGRADRRVLHCTVENLLSIGDDQFRLFLKCFHRELAKPPGLFGWLRRRRP